MSDEEKVTIKKSTYRKLIYGILVLALVEILILTFLQFNKLLNLKLKPHRHKHKHRHQTTV